MTQDVFIFGVGCSGTTMMYGLMQSIFSDIYEGNYYSTYEPFIWDKQQFNLPYDDASDLFGKTSSLSIEGIYKHLMTPMFVGPSSGSEYNDDEFFRHFSATQGPGQPHLAKFIRGNGRMALFRELNPEAKFVLVIRNPVDNINCAKNKFSFFGDDFYPTDYPRFCDEINLSSVNLLDKKCDNWGQKQAEYCYQMNSAAISFAVSDSNTIILEYDSFVRNEPVSVSGLLRFLKIPPTADYEKELQKSIGPVTGSIALNQSEYESILPYDDLYGQLCELCDVVRGKNRNDIQSKYDGNCSSESFDSELEVSTTNQLRRIIRAQKIQIRDLKASEKSDRTSS